MTLLRIGALLRITLLWLPLLRITLLRLSLLWLPLLWIGTLLRLPLLWIGTLLRLSLLRVPLLRESLCWSLLALRTGLHRSWRIAWRALRRARWIAAGRILSVGIVHLRAIAVPCRHCK